MRVSKLSNSRILGLIHSHHAEWGIVKVGFLRCFLFGYSYSEDGTHRLYFAFLAISLWLRR